MKHSKPRPKKQRDEYALARIEELLAKHIDGESELSPTQLKAIEIRYSRLRPTLSAIEQTNVDPRDKADPTEIAARLAAMFNEKPELFEQVIALKNAAQVQQQTAPNEEQRVTH